MRLPISPSPRNRSAWSSLLPSAILSIGRESPQRLAPADCQRRPEKGRAQRRAASSAFSSAVGWSLPSSSAVVKATFPVASTRKAWLGNAPKADSSSPSIPSTVTSYGISRRCRAARRRDALLLAACLGEVDPFPLVDRALPRLALGVRLADVDEHELHPLPKRACSRLSTGAPWRNCGPV